MFDSLARLANRRAKRVGLLALVFFLLAGAIGGSVAERLDPYGADDPNTEAVQAREQLQDAGLRVPAVIAVVAERPGRQAGHAERGSRRWRTRSANAPTSPRSPATTTPARAPSSPRTGSRPTSPWR